MRLQLPFSITKAGAQQSHDRILLTIATTATTGSSPYNSHVTVYSFRYDLKCGLEDTR